MKFLIIRFSSIGDIVLTTPVVRCLKQQMPAAEIHYLTKKNFQGIITTNPYVDKVWAMERHLKEVLLDLQNQNFDYIIDLHGNLRTAQVKWNIGAKSLTFDKINFQKWLMVQLKINHLPKRHIVERYLDTVASLGVTNDGVGLDYFIPPKDEVAVGDFGNYIALVIGAAHSTKRLPKEKIIALCQKIQQPILLLGGKDELETGREIAQKAGQHVINTCGQYNLNQSASIVRQAELVITHDTGLMHIAAAFQKKIISIWGNTIPEFGMYPYYKKENLVSNTNIEVKNLGCRPCSKIGFDQCPKGHFDCMNKIDLRQVADLTLTYGKEKSGTHG
jgi:ADP-heptose:LPS heptosyltransferase